MDGRNSTNWLNAKRTIFKKSISAKFCCLNDQFIRNTWAVHRASRSFNYFLKSRNRRGFYTFSASGKLNFRIHKKDKRTVFFSGVLMGLHWILYFISLKMSTVAMECSVFTYQAITTLLEPLMLNSKFKISNLVLGLMVCRYLFLAPEISLENDQFKAIGYGVCQLLLFHQKHLHEIEVFRI